MSFPSSKQDVDPLVEGTSAAHRVCEAVTERARRDLPEAAFEMWFSALEPGRVRGDVVELLAPTGYVRAWLSGHYMDLIAGTVTAVLGPGARAKLRIAPAPDAAHGESGEGPPPASAKGRREEGRDPKEAGAPNRAGKRTRGKAAGADSAQLTLDGALQGQSLLPGWYTFDTFVPGPSNKFAHAAALAVAEAPPSKAYNPLFVYGGVGLGKTHLLVAVAHHMATLQPRTRIRYVTSESFVTEFIKSVRERRGYQFQRQYRDVDILLLDDVQFLARAEETQTEFFHTFNHLHQHERQIVIASDRPPQELGGIEERLRSRFRSGLVVDVQPPDLETRIAILQLKALRDEVVVPDEVLHFIASQFDTNIRELEGALLRVNAFASITRHAVDLALAEQALVDLIPDSGQDISAATIMDETAAFFGLERSDLVSKSRSRPLTTARHTAMYLLRELTELSLIKIGEQFDRDHTTALHGIKKIEGLMHARGSVYRQVEELTKKVRAKSRGM